MRDNGNIIGSDSDNEENDENLEDSQEFWGASDMDTEEYDRNLDKSKEFWVAKEGLGPYVEFGLSDVHGALTIAIG